MNIFIFKTYKCMHRTKKKTTEEFISEAIEIHGETYNYSNVEYVNQLTEVCIICSEHGEFWQKPKNHLKGYGCPKCGRDKIRKNRKLSTEDFIEKSKKLHGDFYDYTKVKYEDVGTEVCIMCPTHGEFWQKPCHHLAGCGCPKCRRHCEKPKESKAVYNNITDDVTFGKIYNQRYGKNYDFSKCGYVNMKSDVNVVCPKHGNFVLKAFYLMHDGRYCPKCAMEYKKNLFSSNTNEFIQKSKLIHGNNRYDYTLTDYINNKTKVKIICHEKDVNGEEHGMFEQTPANHLKNRGCPKCKEDKLVYENKLYIHLCEIFDKNEIIRQYRNKEILDNLSLDFYIPKYKVAIEHQGSQHFRPLNYFGGVEKFHVLCENDRKKEFLCKENGITLIYFTYEKYVVSDYYNGKIYTDIISFKEKLKEIKENE